MAVRLSHRKLGINSSAGSVLDALEDAHISRIDLTTPWYEGFAYKIVPDSSSDPYAFFVAICSFFSLHRGALPIIFELEGE
jgi:hypothetical protein